MNFLFALSASRFPLRNVLGPCAHMGSPPRSNLIGHIFLAAQRTCPRLSVPVDYWLLSPFPCWYQWSSKCLCMCPYVWNWLPNRTISGVLPCHFRFSFYCLRDCSPRAHACPSFPNGPSTHRLALLLLSLTGTNKVTHSTLCFCEPQPDPRATHTHYINPTCHLTLHFPDIHTHTHWLINLL